MADSDKPALSVDQLTQAFAQLMGKSADGSSTPQPQPEASDAVADNEEKSTSPSETDTSSVTPAQLLEAILFIGHPENEAFSARQIASYLRGVSPQEVVELIEQLNSDYVRQQTPYHIAAQGSGFKLVLRQDYQRLRDSFYGKIRQVRLSQLAIDLLAIVAYHQPIERKRIEHLRGRPCGAVLNQLVRRDLLQIQRTDERPRQKLYRTTDRFLDLFGLESLEDLPQPEAL